MMAAALQTPELALDEAEAKTLASAVAEVASHYDTVVDPKLLAWGNLALAIGVVYGPRIFVLSSKNRKAKRAQSKEGAEPSLSVVSPFGGFHQP